MPAGRQHPPPPGFFRLEEDERIAVVKPGQEHHVVVAPLQGPQPDLDRAGHGRAPHERPVRLDRDLLRRVPAGLLDAGGVEPEYLELRSADDLSPAERVNGRTLLAVAARVGRA